MISYVAPLVFVLVITLVKEFYDDYKRRVRDHEINISKYEKIDMHSGRIVDCQAASLKVGDLIKVS